MLGVGAPLAVIDAPDWRGKDAREQREKARENGETALLAGDYDQVRAMADVVSSHTTAMRLLS